MNMKNLLGSVCREAFNNYHIFEVHHLTLQFTANEPHKEMF